MTAPIVEKRNSFVKNLSEMYQKVSEKEQEIDEAAKKRAGELQKLEERMKRLEEAGTKPVSNWRRKLSIFLHRRRKGYRKLSTAKKVFYGLFFLLGFVVLFLSIQFLAASALAVSLVTMLGSVIAKVAFFAPKIIKSTFVLIKCCTRTYTGTISTWKRHKKVKNCDQFLQNQVKAGVQVRSGRYFKNTILKTASGQKVVLKHSTLNYGIDGFRIMNLYTMVKIPFHAVWYVLNLMFGLVYALVWFGFSLLTFGCLAKESLVSGFVSRVKKAFHDPEKPLTGNFFRWDFWIYMIGNFKTAYIRMDKPENVGPTFLKKQSNKFMRIYREINPAMTQAVDPSVPQNIKEDLSMGERVSDIAISAVTAPGVAAALAMGDVTTALLLLDQTGLMIGADGNLTRCGQKIYIVDDDHHFVCVPADMELTEVFETDDGLVICLEASYGRPKLGLPWKKFYGNEPEDYKWQILVKNSSV